MNEYRAAAWWAGAHISAKLPLVASGYLYLETVVNARDNVIAFPAEQAEHPGWRALPDAGSVPPRGWFYWIGERAAPELLILRRTRIVEPIYANDRAIVARVR